MKLKSLLLGSAAALMTVSGANAADAVFAAEPEPMEYVKVCDTYGNGFFYIPGTETCLSINGYARVEFIHNKASNDGYAVRLDAQKAYKAANAAVTKTVLAQRLASNAVTAARTAGAGAARLAVLTERESILDVQVNQAFLSRANSVADVNYVGAADQLSNAIRENAINRLDSAPATFTPAQIAAFTTARNAALINAARNVLGKTSDYSSWVYRARVNIDARNETDWGTLRSQIRLQGDGTTTDGNVSIDRALISLGGLRVGYSDSFFATHHGYGWQKAANDGYFGYHQAMLLDYTFAANGFSATIGVQDRSSAGVALSGADNFDSYIGAAYSSGFGRLAGSIIYDASASEVAWKISADITAIENLNIHGWYMADNGGTQYVTAGLGGLVAILPIIGITTPEYQWGVDLNYQINTTLNVRAGYTDADLPDAGRFGVGAIWNPVFGFSIRPEAVFGDDYTQVRLRIVRSF